MLIAPKRNKNCLGSNCFSPKTSLPIKAACDAPKPGRNAVKGEAIIEAREAFAIDFFESLIFFKGEIFCSGIFVFCFIEIIKLLAPNNPVNKGRRDSFKFRFSDAIPKNPAKRNMNNAPNLFCFSVEIR